jgi:hypothetical protein
MNKEAFFADPITMLARADVFPTWIQEAWTTDAARFRTRVTEELARTVSKYATMAGHENWTSVLSNALSQEQLSELYQNIRDESLRLEPEWRSEFIHVFPRSSGVLPPPDPVGLRIYYTIELFRLVEVNDSTALQQLLDEIRQQGLHPETMSLTEVELEQIGVALPLAPGGSVNPSRVTTPGEYAQRLGFSHLACYLLPQGR